MRALNESHVTLTLEDFNKNIRYPEIFGIASQNEKQFLNLET